MQLSCQIYTRQACTVLVDGVALFSLLPCIVTSPLRTGIEKD